MFPDLSAAGHAVPASIFARLREHLARFTGDIIPLQIGDTYLAPAAALDAVTWTDPVDLYAYGSPEGWRPLVDAVVAKVRRDNQITDATAANIQIAVGATHALACTLQALCDPGDELVLLTPHWPLIRGIALGLGVRPVEVPFGASIAELEAAITPRTTALYFATPNNPDGAMLTEARLRELIALAHRRNLWLLADEVYEHYGYDAAHVSAAALPGGAERTITVYSFAKSFAQAGVRVGYAVGPAPVVAALKKFVNHTVYNVPVAMQRAAAAALANATFLDDARSRYRAARDRARARLAARAACPPGGAYLWVDFGAPSLPILERCAAAGVLLAPGPAFGDACTNFARLCFTGVAPERLDEGIDRINAVLANGPARTL